MGTDNHKNENSLFNQIKETESKILNVEQELIQLRSDLIALRLKHADSLVINWPDEINRSLVGADNQPVFTSYEVILNNIETKYQILATPKIKKSIIATLSSMFKEGFIGGTDVNNIYYYGLRSLFNDNDLAEIKEEFQTRFNNCRAYVENFESDK